MSVELKAGSLHDFFASAKETAKEIDEGKKVTKKNIVMGRTKRFIGDS